MKRGYLNEAKVKALKKVLINNVESNKGMKDLELEINKIIKPGDLKKYGKTVLSEEVRSKLIARTEFSRILNKTIKKEYKKEGVELVKWNAVLDGRTCSECESLNNKIFEINTNIEPPVHPNCRCSLDIVMTKESWGILKNKSPQEIELELVKKYNVDEKTANKFVNEKFNLK